MTLISEQTSVASWNEPDGIAARGTLIVIPGRGERPELYERFGRAGPDCVREVTVTGYAEVHPQFGIDVGAQRDRGT